jgi:hypothetical protein
MVNKKKRPLSMERRDFICQSAATCCLLHLSIVNRTLNKGDNVGTPTKEMDLTQLATFCGLYCGACDIYQKRIYKSGSELKQILDAYDFHAIAKEVPGLEQYEAFDKVLNVLISFFGQCPGCKKGGGNPECAIRACAKTKEYTTCAECSDFPCERLKIIHDSYDMAGENIEAICKEGLEVWCQKQQKKVDQGLRYTTFLAEKKKKKS